MMYEIIHTLERKSGFKIKRAAFDPYEWNR